ncbi:class I SAM-dependent methyltransferase [Actinotalea sp. Marseille-Q4924]|uniref:class I SAM-dependent methyltransferase n=1 Tax=Actinotalea sp. Marseille-Q4924 TaxID=2866571 RepID=UPI001CE3E0B2|nr:class I SAM-dependent methyltransferase [Actinotalea sp. Marseille-Q4924]
MAATLGRMGMSARFSGEIVQYYARFRRGYPPAVTDRIVEAFGLTADDVVLDLGCGTGQLTTALAGHVGTVIGMDPEPDMLSAAAARTSSNQQPILWVLGSDRDVPVLGRALRPLGALTVAVAIHWMDRDALFRTITPMLRPGGGIAVITNGVPLWLHDTDWSRELRSFLHAWQGRSPSACQTDAAGLRLNRDALTSAGHHVTETTVDYAAPLSVEDVVGGVLSAMDLPPEEERRRFAAELTQRLRAYAPMIEDVSVTLQLAVPR